MRERKLLTDDLHKYKFRRLAINALFHAHSARFDSRACASGFINAAYMTPIPTAALDAMHDRVKRYERPDFAMDDFFGAPERVRALLANIVGGDASQFSLTGAASFGLSTLAWNLRTQADRIVGGKRKIIGVDGQFPSNVQAWKRLEQFGFTFDLVEGGANATDRVLNAIDDDTALVAIAPLSWTDGLRLDINRICARVREAGARFALDVTQSIGVDAALSEDLTCDVVVGAGYKWLLGPYGTGFLRLTKEMQELLEPLESSWKNFAESDDFNRLNDYQSNFMSPAAAFDHGQSSAFVRIAGLEAALTCLIEIGPDQISAHCRAFGLALTDALDESLFEISEVDADSQAAHLFRIAPRDPSRFEPLSKALAEAGVSVSQRNGGWRISPHVYNDSSDIERILSALR